MINDHDGQVQAQFNEYLDRSPAFLTSDDFITSNEIIRTKWPNDIIRT